MTFSLLVTQVQSYLEKEFILVVNFDYQAHSFDLLVQMKGKAKPMVNILPRLPSFFIYFLFFIFGHLKYINKYKYFRKVSCSLSTKS